MPESAIPACRKTTGDPDPVRSWCSAIGPTLGRRSDVREENRMTTSATSSFRAAIDAYSFDGVVLPDDIARAVRDGLDESGIVVVGESHGVHETPAVVLALAVTADARGIALEWS